MDTIKLNPDASLEEGSKHVFGGGVFDALAIGELIDALFINTK